MNGLPANIDLTLLCGTEVIQLCFGSAPLQIHFANRSRVCVEGDVVLSGPDGDVGIEDYPREASLLCDILGDRVLAASRQPDSGLLLAFESGRTLYLVNDSNTVESFQLHLGSETFVA